jgi:hypothetical protein
VSYEAPAPIGQKAQPATVGGSCKTAKAVTTRARAQVRAYFNELLIDENLVFNVVPIPSTAAMITNAMPVAIRQYSIAVAPDSSERNARTVFMLSTYRASLSVG